MHTDAEFEDVLAAARVGAGWAFERLYVDLKRPVAAFVRAHGARDPDDVTSEAFLQVFRNLASFEGDQAAFRSWVFTIARRRVLDSFRHDAARPTEVALDGAEHPMDADTATVALANVADDRVATLLASLTEDQREVVLLRLVADLSLRETAEVTGRNVNAVKQLQHRALNALRRAATGEGVTP